MKILLWGVVVCTIIFSVASPNMGGKVFARIGVNVSDKCFLTHAAGTIKTAFRCLVWLKYVTAHCHSSGRLQIANPFIGSCKLANVFLSL